MFYEKENSRSLKRYAKQKTKITTGAEMVLRRHSQQIAPEQKLMVGVLVQALKDSMRCSNYNLCAADVVDARDFIASNRCEPYCEVLGVDPDLYRAVIELAHKYHEANT